MGNKSSADGNRRHSIDGVLSEDDFVSDKKKSDKKKQNSAKKSTSMYAKNPDDWVDGGVTNPADVKIYRSTSTGEDIQRRHRKNDNGPDVRVYRRSAVGPTFADEGTSDAEPKPRHSSSTLPRNFGRKTITVVDGRSMKNGDVANDSQLSARSAAGGGVRGPTEPVYSSIQRPGSRTSIRVGNGQLSAAAAAGVTLSDFPDTESVKRRLCLFENRFVERFTALYSALPETVQLSALSIAVRRRSSHPAAYYGDLNDHVISLWHYLRPPSHSDLVDHELPPEEFALTIHPDLFRRLQLYRIETTNNATITGNEGCSLTDIVRELVWSIAAEAAITISTAFEYQIGLLGDGLPCQLLADRAADCTIDFLKKTNRHLDVNALASGVIRGRPADVRVATVSVVIGQKELKWNIDEILYRPGLRKDTLLTAVDANDVARRYSTPWKFYTSTVPGADEFVDPTIYGFRGQLLHRDFEAVETLRSGTSQPFYRVDADEEHLYNVEVMWRPEDFHRLYIPYRRFVGMALLDAYTASTAQNVWNSTGLVEFIQKLTKSVDASQCRSDIEPVVRPLSWLREQQLPLQRPPTNGIRPRCVSDAEEEFSRQQTFRQTWCPGGTVAAAAAARQYQNTAANDYRPLASPAAAAAADPVALSLYRQSTLHNKPLTIDSAYSTASTTAGVIVIDRPTSPPLAPLNTSGFYRDSPVPQTAPVLGSNQFNGSRHPPDLLPVRTVVDGNDNFVTSSSGRNSVVRRSVVSNSSASTEQPTPASPQNDSGNNTPSKSNYFPSIDQLFGKQLRAMKSKTIHVTEFPVEESNVASNDNGVEQSAGSVEVKLVEKDLAMSNNSPATANSDSVFFEDRQQNGAVRTSVTSPTPVSAAGVVTFRKPPPPPVKPRTKSLLSSPDVANVNRQSLGNDVTLGYDVSSTTSGVHSPTAAAVRTNGYDMTSTMTTVTEVETSSIAPKSLMISDI